MAISVAVEDVRNRGDLTDYTGELRVTSSLRGTDRNNYGDPATGELTTFTFAFPCAATGDESAGSTCSINTSADAVSPGAVVEGMRAIWELGRIAIFDGGADGLAATEPNTAFARQGLFVP